MRSQLHVVENETAGYNVSPFVQQSMRFPEMLIMLGVLLLNEVGGAKTKSYISSTMEGISGVGGKLEEIE
jgi:hypothetical protein